MSHQVLDQFSSLINYYPAIFHGNNLNLLFLNDAQKIDDPQQYFKHLSACILMDEQREFFLGSDLNLGIQPPFPQYLIDQRPEPRDLSEMLFQRFDLAKKYIFSQENIAEFIVNLSIKNKPDVVVLILVDGLSYYDIPEQEGLQPCFVPGLTTTDFGFRTIIGKPSISNRMFFAGYKRQKAYSFFDYSNTLSGAIHDGFSEAHYIRIREVKEIFKALKSIKPKHNYIQIVLDGLDSLCHNHRDAPPIEYYKGRIINCLEEVESIFIKKKLHYQIHLVSDHGILWNDTYDKFIIVNDLFPEDAYHPRYIKGTFNRMYGRIGVGLGSTFTLFKAPYISRDFRNNEWGMHGGISAWESIVPFITRTG